MEGVNSPDLAEMSADEEDSFDDSDDSSLIIESDQYHSSASDNEDTFDQHETAAAWSKTAVDLNNDLVQKKLSFDDYSKLKEKQVLENLVLDQDKDESDAVKKIVGALGPRRKLPRSLLGLMGQANLCFARGLKDDAIAMCMEVVRQAPEAPEPFQTLAMIYEDKGEGATSLQYSLIAAFLGSSDLEEWIWLAQRSEEQGDTNQALTCYSRALSKDPKCIAAMVARCDLYRNLNKPKKVLEGYQAMLKCFEAQGDTEKAVKVMRDIAKIQHEQGDTLVAIDTMFTCLSQFAGSISAEEINLVLELLIMEKRFEDALQILTTHCGVVMETDEYSCCVSCTPPEDMPVDFRVRLIVCLISQRALNIVDPLVASITCYAVDDIGDLFLDVAEAFMAVGEHGRALPLLASLVKSTKFDMPAVWLRQAECFASIGETEQAVHSYRTVLQMVPSHTGARMSLSSLLQQLGQTEEALQSLSLADKPESRCFFQPKSGNEPKNLQLWFQMCSLLYTQGKKPDFVMNTIELFNERFPSITTTKEIKCVFGIISHKRWRELQAVFQNRRSQTIVRKKIVDDTEYFASQSIQLEEIWSLFKKLCSVLYDLGEYKTLLVTTRNARAYKAFASDPAKDLDIGWFHLMAMVKLKMFESCYIICKEMCNRGDNLNQNRLWNLFAFIGHQSPDRKFQKYCMRMLYRHQDHRALALLNGHHALIASTYKHALAEYLSLYQLDTKDPMLSFLLGVVFAQVMCQRFTSQRNTILMQMIAFFNQYKDYRGECQETVYNLARALHQIGLIYVAVHLYERVLNMPPIIETESGKFDLKREAAFNLSLIYQNSGSIPLARYYLYKYCIV